VAGKVRKVIHILEVKDIAAIKTRRCIKLMYLRLIWDHVCLIVLIEQIRSPSTRCSRVDGERVAESAGHLNLERVVSTIRSKSVK